MENVAEDFEDRVPLKISITKKVKLMTKGWKFVGGTKVYMGMFRAFRNEAATDDDVTLWCQTAEEAAEEALKIIKKEEKAEFEAAISTDYYNSLPISRNAKKLWKRIQDGRFYPIELEPSKYMKELIDAKLVKRGGRISLMTTCYVPRKGFKPFKQESWPVLK